MSGAVTERPELVGALGFMRGGDMLGLWKLDRLARSMKQFIETVDELRAKGIGFRSLTEALDTTPPQGRLVFHIFGALPEFEPGYASAPRQGLPQRVALGARPARLND
jgi:DNA invertase Pin-like site-specific DNA recombinase